MNPSGLSPGITVAAPPALPESPSVLPPESDLPGNPPGGFQVGTYNIGGANDEAKQEGNIKKTIRTLASQVVGGVDVVALQEVNVGVPDTRSNLPVVNNPSPHFADDYEGIPFKQLVFETFDDHNEYLLAQIAAEEQGLQGGIRYSREERIDYLGNREVVITGVDESGRESQVTITKEFYNADGIRASNLFNKDLSANSTITTVYNADVKAPEGVRDYTVVFGPARDRWGGAYGNAVVLGPNAQLRRDDDGNIEQIKVHDLIEADEAPDGYENRTALEVGIEVDGVPATIFSTHLTVDKKEGEKDADQEGTRAKELEKIGSLAEEAGENTILLGDFNSDTFEVVGPLSGENDDENHVDIGTQMFWEIYGKALKGKSEDENIDRIYVSGVKASNRDEDVYNGGSDHDLVTWEIDLNGGDLGPTSKPGP